MTQATDDGVWQEQELMAPVDDAKSSLPWRVLNLAPAGPDWWAVEECWPAADSALGWHWRRWMSEPVAAWATIEVATAAGVVQRTVGLVDAAEAGSLEPASEKAVYVQGESPEAAYFAIYGDKTYEWSRRERCGSKTFQDVCLCVAENRARPDA